MSEEKKKWFSEFKDAQAEMEKSAALARLKVRPPDIAPKRGSFLAFGKPTDVEYGVKNLPLGWYSAYWDSLDEAFYLSGATCNGPFIRPLAWCELPANPEMEVKFEDE